jgi:hypothetical protein
VQNKYGAQRALQRNGELVSRQLMVGVQPLEGRMRSAALGLTGQQQEAASSSSLAKPTSALPSSSQLQPQLQPMRPYRIEAPASQVDTQPACCVQGTSFPGVASDCDLATIVMLRRNPCCRRAVPHCQK